MHSLSLHMFVGAWKKKSQCSGSYGSSGFNGLMASLPKCCALQRVSIQSIVNAHSLAFWPEYVILMITAPLLRLDTMAHLKGICFLRSFFTGYTELYGLTAWPCVALFLIRVVLWSVSPCPHMISVSWLVVQLLWWCINNALKQRNQKWRLEPKHAQPSLTGPGKIAFNQSMKWLQLDECSIGCDGFSFVDLTEAL